MAAEHPESQCFAVPVNDIPTGYKYPAVVRFEIEEQDLPSYQCAAEFLNMSNADIVCVQHEFCIYGGPAGGHLLALLRELRMPVVPTLHITNAAPGLATIWWTPPTPGSALQSSDSLAPTNWVNAPSGPTNPATVLATLPARFYRLTKP